MKEVECKFCGGKGTDPFQLMSAQSVCQVCKGSGKVVVQDSHAECVFCKGKGVYPVTRLTCTVCGGIGYVAKGMQEHYKKCKSCSGKGRAPHSGLPCTRCGGTGVVKK